MTDNNKGIVDSLRVAATYVPGTVEGSVMDKAAEIIERLEAAVQTLMNQNNTLNDGIKVLTDQTVDYGNEVTALKAKETRLVEDRDHYRELLQLSHDRERQQRDKLETVQGLIRLAYRTVRQD